MNSIRKRLESGVLVNNEKAVWSEDLCNDE